MISMEIDTKRGEITIHADDEGAALLRQAAEDLTRNGPSKVLIGNPGSMLVLRHVDYAADEQP